MTTPKPTSLHAAAQRTDLVTLTENDLIEIASFIGAQSDRTRESVARHLRWFLLENPARRTEDALGFGLRAADQLVGCILCVPQIFRAGNNNLLLMGSSSFYVDDHHRGHGGRIFLRYSRLAAQHPLFGTSANAQAAELWKASGATPIPHSDAELFGVLHWPPVAEEYMHRKYASRLLSRLAGSPLTKSFRLLRPLKIDDAESDVLHPLTSAEQVNDLALHKPSAKLTAVRDLLYIRWRYFSGEDATVAAFTFRSRKPDQDILVTINRRTRGYRSQINTLNVLDVYPEVSLEDWLRLLGALIARHTGDVDAIVLRSQNPDQQNLLCKKGFRRRAFDAPTGWFLDRANLLPIRDWYAVPADGDGLI
jgi:GNAT superfamily N-acetyltransferase